MSGHHLTRLLVASVCFLVWLMCFSDIALASEACMIPFGTDHVIGLFYVKCPDYCCKYRNGSQYCCGDCNVSVNADSCMPEQLWRFILYVGLGIAGAVLLCYLIVYVIKNYKEPMKRACCKQRTSRVQDPSISMTATSAWSPGPPVNHHRSRQAAATDGEFYDGGSESDCQHQLRYPLPPAYTAATDNSVGDQQLERRETSATPPPVYFSVETEAPESAAAAAAAVSNPDEPPPAYSEATIGQQQQQQQQQQ